MQRAYIELFGSSAELGVALFKKGVGYQQNVKMKSCSVPGCRNAGTPAQKNSSNISPLDNIALQ